MPDISIVIPLYNKEQHISRAISSVLLQSVKNFDLIIVDDGSTDNGRQIAESFKDNRIKVISQKNSGVSEARNLGIHLANSNIVAFLDADDEWKDHFLETILSLRHRYPKVGAYGTAYDIMLPNGNIYHPHFNYISAGWQGILPSYFKACVGLHILCASSTAIPKSTFETVGYFPSGERLGEDLDMWLRIALSYPIAFSNRDPQSIYHQESINRTHILPVSVERLPYIQSAEAAIRSGNLAPGIKRDLIEYVAYRKIGYAKLSVLRGDPREGRAILSGINTNRFGALKNMWFLLSYVPTFLFDFARNGKCFIHSIMRHRTNLK